jgi:transcriptional regulator with XRE-family HTH domain
MNKILQTKINEILKEKNLSLYGLEKILNYSAGGLSQMIKGETPFSKNIKKKLLPVLEVSKEEFESWIVADKYKPEIIKKALDSIKNKEEKTLILTQNIDKILKEKILSRTALSKLIKHSQSGLNRVITGKEPLSKNVMEKLSIGLEVSKDDLQAWVLADKYSFEILELALKVDKAIQ